jgi:hypothetical protein
MPWGSTELEIGRPVSGADEVPVRSVTAPSLANEAECRARSTAAN